MLEPCFWFFFSAIVFDALLSLFLKWDWSSNFVVFEFYFLDCVFPSCYIELANGGLVPVSEALKFVSSLICIFERTPLEGSTLFLLVWKNAWCSWLITSSTRKTLIISKIICLFHVRYIVFSFSYLGVHSCAPFTLKFLQ